MQESHYIENIHAHTKAHAQKHTEAHRYTHTDTQIWKMLIMLNFVLNENQI